MVSVSDIEPDSRWATETFAAAEEQVERSFKKGIMYTLSHPTAWKVLLLAGLVGITLGMIMEKVSTSDRNLSGKMWLTKTDIAELEPDIASSSALSQEKQAEILKRQLKNIQQGFTAKPLSPKWPLLLVAVPVFVVLGSFIYLVSRCYPPGVFLWGDNEEWYKNLLRRRAYVWNTIIGSMAIGVLSGMLLLGAEGLFK
jgi:hypothetical protein